MKNENSKEKAINKLNALGEYADFLISVLALYKEVESLDKEEQESMLGVFCLADIYVPLIDSNLDFIELTRNLIFIEDENFRKTVKLITELNQTVLKLVRQICIDDEHE